MSSDESERQQARRGIRPADRARRLQRGPGGEATTPSEPPAGDRAGFWPPDEDLQLPDDELPLPVGGRTPGVWRELRAIPSFTNEHAFLSNFHPSPMAWAGMAFPTAEHLYQARKTYEPAWTRRIAEQPTPGLAKKMGRAAPLHPNWEIIKFTVMTQVVEQKFRDHPELAAQLVATRNAVLVEGNTWHDQCWGDCMCSQHADKPGANALGIILMRLRLELM